MFQEYMFQEYAAHVGVWEDWGILEETGGGGRHLWANLIKETHQRTAGQ